MTTRRALFIVNRNCRQGKTDLSAIIARLRDGGIEVVQEYALNVEQMGELLKRRAREFDLLILGGGDGTLRSAIKPVLQSGLPLAVMPLGTANDLARGLGIPMDPLQAAGAIAEGVEHRIDLGHVNDHYFFNASSIGLGVAVTRQLSYGLKQRWGWLSYARALWNAVSRVRAFGAEVDCDGAKHYLRSIQITVGNGRYYGGGMTVHAQAALDDQLLHLYSLPPQPLWRLTKLLPALRRGAHDRHEEVTVFHGRHIEIRTSRPRMVTADGELASRTPAVYEVLPAALSVVVPRQAQQGEGLKNVAH